KANLRNDCYQDVDTAAYLTNHFKVPVDNKHPGELLAFGNNYFFIYTTSLLLRLFGALGIEEVVRWLQGINAFAMLLGVFLTWLFAKESFGIQSANRVLLLLALNPLFYGFTFWYYSNSLSIPIMMAIPCVGLVLYRNIRRIASSSPDNVSQKKAWLKVALCGAALGLLVFLGFEVRPTAVFPFIALVVMAFFLLSKRPCIFPVIAAAVPFFLALALSFAAFLSVRNARFGDLLPHNRPITYWLSMGSHGNGNKSSKEDALFVKSLSNEDDKARLCLERALENYKENGICGTVDLWARKTAYTWSDGFGQISRRIVAGETESSLLSFFAGPNVGLFTLYCQAYRFTTVAGAFLFCVDSWHRRRRETHNAMLITLLGGVVFYMLWEARGVYSAPFIPALLLLAEAGFDLRFQNQTWFVRSGRVHKTPLFCCAMTAVFVGMMFYSACNTPVAVSHYRIYTKGKLRHYHIISEDGILPETAGVLMNSRSEIEDEELGFSVDDAIPQAEIEALTDHLPRTIEQDFYVQKAFNRLTIAAFAPQTKGEVSDYRILLSADSGKTLYETTITGEDVEDGSLKLDFEPIGFDGNEHYRLRIERLSPDKQGIVFFSKYDSYALGAYDGTLVVDGKDGFVNDLGLTVELRAENAPYLSETLRIFVVGILLLLAGLLIWGNVREDQRGGNGQA
ncbi:MAG: hypothetical protein IJ679_00190, partial [Lachnospiraceae bacterium]|nr:hypothetical protein [Lachnospiraceae bacterium]